LRDADLHLMLRANKVMESKAPNLEGHLKTPCEVLYLHFAPLMARSSMRGARMKTKHFLAMRKDTVAHKCVDLAQEVDPKPS